VSAAAAVCDGQLVYSTPTTVVLAAVFALLAVVTIAGNTLVVAAFSTDAKLRSFGNYFILNLAASDLVVGLLIAVYAPVLGRNNQHLRANDQNHDLAVSDKDKVKN